jgi:ribosomal protein S24E
MSHKRVEISNDLKKALYNVACDVIKGKYGNGSVNRRAKIYDNVRKAVNNLLKG